uniref:Uncharacterized protein n=1 Tax=Rhizophora mucronata TaxID=61149 RepID=A0A2P2KL77_RHIMU
MQQKERWGRGDKAKQENGIKSNPNERWRLT